ncbi:MAG: hypothetical protein SVZ03_02550 [Spirochaetota bacterium]|nr:hypothetical protein [Spirochaetota bacterium]
MFIFRTKPITIRIPIAKLSNFHGIFPIDRCGNAVSIQAIELSPDICAYGFLRGMWEKEDSIFYGAWKSIYGKVTGYLKGEYENGGFHGKYISKNGEFKGFLKGYYRDVPQIPGGIFKGDWFDADMEKIRGKLGGHYLSHPPNTDSAKKEPSGYFHGRWIQLYP